MDQGYQNSEGHDGTGRFAPLWSRQEGSKFNLQPLSKNPIGWNDSHYQSVKTAKTGLLLAPQSGPFAANPPHGFPGGSDPGR